MRLYPLIKIQKGTTAFIGSGGKTTMLKTLAEELPGTVILCTTTHFYPFEGLPVLLDPEAQAVAEALKKHRVVVVGSRAKEGKLTAGPLSCTELERLADYVLVEADGSRQMPMKAHADFEPVIPPEAGRVVWVVGANAFGKAVEGCVHRAELFCRRTGASPADPVEPEHLVKLLQAEQHIRGDVVFLNRGSREQARIVADGTGRAVVWGNLWEKHYQVFP